MHDSDPPHPCSHAENSGPEDFSTRQPIRLGFPATARSRLFADRAHGRGNERKLLSDTKVDLGVLNAGCCGLAGNFGFEKGHYDVSVACAEGKLLPALRDADPEALVLADGFSCRTQIRDLAPDRRPMHVAQVLASALSARTRGASTAQVVHE